MDYKAIADRIDRISSKTQRKLELYEEKGDGFLGDIIEELETDLYNLASKLRKMQKRFDSTNATATTTNLNQN
jgi:hypothetical protein